MIAKKNSRLDLERKKNALFFIGLMTAGSFTLAAFTYSTPLERDIDKRVVGFELVEFTTDYEEVPQEKPIIEKQHNNQNDEQKQKSIDATLDLTEDLKSVDNTKKVAEAKVVLKATGWVVGDDIDFKGDISLEDDIPEWVDVDAKFIGGTSAMKKYIKENCVYPEDAIRFGEAGTVYVSFVIEKDGSVSNIEVVGSASKTLDREAKRIVRGFPKWIPGELNYEVVRSRIRLPIVFEITP